MKFHKLEDIIWLPILFKKVNTICPNSFEIVFFLLHVEKSLTTSHINVSMITESLPHFGKLQVQGHRVSFQKLSKREKKNKYN